MTAAAAGARCAPLAAALRLRARSTASRLLTAGARPGLGPPQHRRIQDTIKFQQLSEAVIKVEKGLEVRGARTLHGRQMLQRRLCKASQQATGAAPAPAPAPADA